MSFNKLLVNKKDENSSFSVKIKKIFPMKSSSQINEILITDKLYTQCNICLFYYIKIYHTDKCLHYMCSKCLEVWSKIKKECPVCRKQFNRIYSKSK
jgi:hypothetical protein